MRQEAEGRRHQPQRALHHHLQRGQHHHHQVHHHQHLQPRARQEEDYLDGLKDDGILKLQNCQDCNMTRTAENSCIWSVCQVMYVLSIFVKFIQLRCNATPKTANIKIESLCTKIVQNRLILVSFHHPCNLPLRCQITREWDWSRGTGWGRQPSCHIMYVCMHPKSRGSELHGLNGIISLMSGVWLKLNAGV